MVASTRGLVAIDLEDELLRRISLIVATLMLVAPGRCHAADDPTVKSEDGEYLDKEGNPTFEVAADGTVGLVHLFRVRRYHSECHVCHGPDGMGSTYAPALKESLETIELRRLPRRRRRGRKNVNTAQESVMPAFGDNPNVACYMDDLYVYLRARAA